mmetsp:Transcript_33311/g.73144  ORF Transcript_33311/g.73144 Transcript_33311/m.73144 type:complete len:143 (-) Transcript_33311:379-807(-)
MPPANRTEAEKVGFKITGPEDWAKVHGDDAEKDFLHIIEVYVTWCGSSLAITSTFSRLIAELQGRKIKFFNVNADDIDDLKKYRSTSKPHFLVYKNGEQLEVIEGVNVPALQKSITDHMPEGLVDTEETDAAENAEDDEYEQ